MYCDSSRFRVLVAGRRFGKTFLGPPILLKMVEGKAEGEAWYIAPTYRQAKMIAWRRLKRLCEEHIAGKPNESELSIELKSGARLCLKGANNPDSLRGPGLDGVVWDEYAYIAPEAWTEVVRPMLADRNGSALFIGTPEGRNHFYELGQQAKTTPGWSYHQYTTIEGGNVTAEEIEAARRDLDERTFRQEFEASFETYGGAVYYAFLREQNVSTEAFFNPIMPLCWSLDFNVNPMCSVIGQVEDKTTRSDMMMGRRSLKVNVIEELVLPNSNTPEACEEFVRRARLITHGRTTPLKVYGDAAGGARSTAGKSDWQIVREYLGRCPDFQVSYNVPSANPAVKDRVNAVNAMLCSAYGERRLLVHPSCRELIKDLEQVIWKEDAGGNTTGQIDKSDSQRTHASDALGYWIESEFGLKGTIGYRQERIF